MQVPGRPANVRERCASGNPVSSHRADIPRPAAIGDDIAGLGTAAGGFRLGSSIGDRGLARTPIIAPP